MVNWDRLSSLRKLACAWGSAGTAASLYNLIRLILARTTLANSRGQLACKPWADPEDLRDTVGFAGCWAGTSSLSMGESSLRDGRSTPQRRTLRTWSSVFSWSVARALKPAHSLRDAGAKSLGCANAESWGGRAGTGWHRLLAHALLAACMAWAPLKLALHDAAAQVLFAGMMSGLTLGLMSMDIVELEVLRRSGSETEAKQAERIIPVIKDAHFLLVRAAHSSAASSACMLRSLQNRFTYAVYQSLRQWSLRRLDRAEDQSRKRACHCHVLPCRSRCYCAMLWPWRPCPSSWTSLYQKWWPSSSQ